MLGNSVIGLGRHDYGLLYVIPATYLYILVMDMTTPLLILDRELSSWAAIALLVLSTYAVIWMHQASLRIFGDTAGMSSQKTTEVINKHMIYFATGVLPSKLPATASILKTLLAAIETGEVRWGVFLRFTPASFLYAYALVAWFWLTWLFHTGGGDLLGGAFWLALTVFIMRDRVVGYLPSYIPRESVPGIAEAEYMRNRRLVHTESNKENRPRIQKKKPPRSRIR